MYLRFSGLAVRACCLVESLGWPASMGFWQLRQVAGLTRHGAVWTTQSRVRLPKGPESGGVWSLVVGAGPGWDASPMRVPLPMAVFWARVHRRMASVWAREGGWPVVCSIHIAMACGVGLVAALVLWRLRGRWVLRCRRLRLGLAGRLQ